MDYADYVNGVGILLLLLWALVLGIDLRRAISSIRRAISDTRDAASKTKVAITGIRDDLSEVKCAVEAILDRLSRCGPHHHYSSPGCPDQYCIWAYRQGTWQLDRECFAPGFEAGPPPDREGWYEGEVVKTMGIRKQEG